MIGKIPYIDEFVAVGINHCNAPVGVRERFAMSEEKRDAFLTDAASCGLKDLIILSTCNRTELFARTTKEGLLSEFLLNHVEGTAEEFAQFGFRKRGEDAIRHFFRVAVGLEAQILGDLQIINQVKAAYDSAASRGMMDSLMHRLMQSVFRAHKRSRNETKLASGAATVAYAAVQAARQRFSTLADKSIVLVGTGKIGKVTCKNLLNMGAREVVLINRNIARAEKLGDRYELPVCGFDQLREKIDRADLVIVATGSDTPVIRMEHLNQNRDKSRRLVMLDLSVPRNIAPEIGELPFVELVNMDMLTETTDEAYKIRQGSIPGVEAIIQDEFELFAEWLQQQKVVPTIRLLNEKLEHIRKSELERYQNKTGTENLDDIEILTQRIINKIAAHSIEHLRNANGKADEITGILTEMFKLKSRQ